MPKGTRRLEDLPGIGKKMASDLRKLGVTGVQLLAKRNPVSLYKELCRLERSNVDKCVLYAFRCAVYNAKHHGAGEKFRKWWNWKDGTP